MENRGLEGYRAEVYFEYVAMKNGVVLSKPIQNLSCYDYIADIENRLIKCQVKKTRLDKRYSCWICELRRTRSKKIGMTTYPRKVYKEGDFDFLCAVIPDDAVYIIPWQEISDKRNNICLGGSKRDKYLKFRNNWRFNSGSP